MKIFGTVGEPRARRHGWSQQVGDFVEYEWRGAPFYCEQLVATLRGQCAECDASIEGIEGIVRARFANATNLGQEEQLQVEIRLTRNDVQKSILEPSPDGFFPNVTDTELRYIRAYVADPLDDEAFTYLMQTASAEARSLAFLAQSGVEYRIVSQPVILQVTTASANYQWPNFTGAAGAVFSESAMRSLLRKQPNFTIPSTGAVPPSTFFFGWRLTMPTYEDSSNGQTSETLEFEFGLWAGELFDYIP